MTEINLLPWREFKREYNKKLLMTLMFSCVAAAIALVVFINCYVVNRINQQIVRNQMLHQAIVVYERQIMEMNNQEKRRQRLLSRMRAVHHLQSTRTLLVHLLDELIKVTPSGVFLSKIEGNNNLITLSGYAESNTYVSLLMQNMEHNQWMHTPKLSEIKKVSTKNFVANNEFKLTLVLESKQPIKERVHDHA